MEYLLIILTIVICLYGKKKNWSLLFLSWVILQTFFIISFERVGTEIIVLALAFLASFAPYLYYTLYFKINDDPFVGRSRFLAGLLIASVLFILGVIFVLVSNNQLAFEEMFTDVQMKKATIFQLMEHYEKWGSIVSCFVVFCFASVVYARNFRGRV